jgi:hypothetical protein
MDFRAIADEAVQRVRSDLVGSHIAGTSVDGVFWYGAIDLDPVHLVVWILLSSADDGELPEWFFGPGDGGIVEPPNDRLDAELLSAMAEIQTAVRRQFAARGWPAPETARVGFDSSARVAASGGWSYFK